MDFSSVQVLIFLESIIIQRVKLTKIQEREEIEKIVENISNPLIEKKMNEKLKNVFEEISSLKGIFLILDIIVNKK